MNRDFDVTVSVWNEFHAPELCEGLARNGFRVLALRSGQRPLEGVTSFTSQKSRILTQLFQRSQWRLLLEAAQDSFEIFARRRTGHSPVFWGWNGHHLSAFQAARRKSQRIICERGSTHSVWAARRLKEVHRNLGWGPTSLELSPRDKKALEEYRLSDAIIVPSRFVKDTFLQEGIAEEKLHTNPYGVDIHRWTSVQGSHREDGPLVFIYTASLIPRKGIHILLKAWHEAALQDAELWLCGSVHIPLKELAIPIDPNVRLLGYTQHDRLAKLYDRAAVYLLPSFEEGMARSGIEALASGLPGIITEETGLTDLTKGSPAAWVVESGNVEQLIETLRTVAANRHSLPALSKTARLCASNYSKEAYGNRAADFAKSFFP